MVDIATVFIPLALSLLIAILSAAKCKVDVAIVERENTALESTVARLIAENTSLRLRGNDELKREKIALENELRDMGVNMSRYRVDVSSGKCEVVLKV